MAVGPRTQQQLLAWAASRAIDVAKLSLDDSGLLGALVAAKDISAGETIISLPESAWLSAGLQLDCVKMGFVSVCEDAQ